MKKGIWGEKKQRQCRGGGSDGKLSSVFLINPDNIVIISLFPNFLSG